MRVLEGRFHPATKSVAGFVVVGEAVRPFDSDRLHEKLEFLVTSVVGDRARALLRLESGFWSFVETPDLDGHPGAA